MNFFIWEKIIYIFLPLIFQCLLTSPVVLSRLLLSLFFSCCPLSSPVVLSRLLLSLFFSCCPQSSRVVSFLLLLSSVVSCCPQSSLVVSFLLLLSYVVSCCPQSSLVVSFLLLLSSVVSCCPLFDVKWTTGTKLIDWSLTWIQILTHRRHISSTEDKKRRGRREDATSEVKGQ